MDAKWTPGPWEWHSKAAENGDNDGSVLAGVESGRAICICKAPRYARMLQWQPNARLIAAAPELYEALESALDIMEATGCAWSDPMGYEENPAYTSARAALAKARGES